jgi:TIR domain
MAASIFISFAGRDLKTADAIRQALEARGFSCWIASRDVPPGENFQIAIVRAIRAAQVMVLVFTHHSNHSEEVAKELALASQTRLRVVPLRMEEVLPNEALAYEFATRQWIDFNVDWNTALEQLCQRLTATLAAPAAGEVPVVQPARPAPRPRKRSPAGLLVGLILLAALAAGGYFFLKSRPAPAASTPVAAAPVTPTPAAKPPPAETNDVPF